MFVTLPRASAPSKVTSLGIFKYPPPSMSTIFSFVPTLTCPAVIALVSRSEPNAVITDSAIAKDQYETLSGEEIITKSGKKKVLLTQTSCIHGDNPNCLQILKAIRNHV